MPCNCNTPTTTPCGCQPCEDTNPGCSCPIKDLSTDCILYTGPVLTCSSIETDTVLTDLLVQLDQFVCDKFEEAINYLTLTNVGSGAEVFRGISGIGEKELRTIVSEDTSLLDVVQNADTIGVRAGTPSLSLDSATDILSLIMTTLSGAITLSNIDLSEYNYDTFVQDATFSAITDVLTITRNNGEPNIDVDLSYLGNHLETVTYNTATSNIEFILTDSTLLTLSVPDFLNSSTLPISSETQQGIIEIATQTEVDAGVDDERAIVPSTLSTYVSTTISNPSNLPNSTEDQRGIAEIATQTEVDAGVDDERIVTPAKLFAYINDPVNIPVQGATKLLEGSVFVGDIGGGVSGNVPVTGGITTATKTISSSGQNSSTIVVSFPSLGTSQYNILLDVVSLGDVEQDNTLSQWVVLDKTDTSFTINQEERSGGDQNIRYDIAII